MQIIENEWLMKIKAHIKKVEPTAELILYGSRARGSAKSESDWDFLILTEKEHISQELERAFRMPIFLQEIETGEIFSLQIFTKKDWYINLKGTPYYDNVQKDGIKL
jgi:predicted nucleotidyltransferase